jgi:signal transduction histidine kinase/ActR/RegA family two-component response regulator
MSSHPADSQTKAASVWMTGSILAEVLAQDSLAEMARELCQQMRELTGARTAAFLQHSSREHCCTPIAVIPERRTHRFHHPSITHLCPFRTTADRFVVTKDLVPDHPLHDFFTSEAVETTLVVPLEHNSIPFGSIMLMDLPDLSHVEQINSLFETLTPILVLAFERRQAQDNLRDQNALLEERVAERTKELELLNSKLSIALGEAKAADKAKSDFIAVMNHELRTPLNPIIGLTELLLREEHSEETKAFLQIIYDSGQHLLELISDILEFCKAGAGGLQLSPKILTFGPFAETIQTIIEPLAKDKGIDFLLRLQDPDTTFMTDPLRLRQVLINLCSNAVKFTYKGSVTLEIKSLKEGKTCFKVIDTGIGISETDQKDIFSPFMQVDSSDIRKEGGTGLGLAIALNLSKCLGGSLDLTSKVGHGSCFTLILPASPPVSTPVLKKASAQIAPSEDTPILIVEDSLANAQVLQLQLKKVGFQKTTVAHTGKKALELIKESAFSFVLVDLNLPDISGTTVVKSVLADPSILSKPLFIAQSALVTNDTVSECLGAGFIDFIRKPISLESLKRAFATTQAI